MEILYGVISGIINGLGMGGGSLLILIFTFAEGLNQKEAQASNLIFFIPTSIAVIIKNRKIYKIDKKLVLEISVFGIIGSIVRSIYIKQYKNRYIKKAIWNFFAYYSN